ncbi:hypothetical protein GGQ80_001007 [Sphingomonas jinjuensis]|uniref:Uncharacterized protein n=1 Tax=Sphingomonas jinjuensis TaxID=535907 RepID=A0A840F5R3_9SPHN|nr:hypothetical protein [Sphingomonas jinjuensis]MBB4153119.1 hypothetical protein [Sphingomonas jinjuensis]
MMVGGAAAALLSLLMRTSVPNDPVLAAITSLPVASTLNLGLLQYQQLAFMAGLAIFVAGAVFVGAGAIVESMRPQAMAATPLRAPIGPSDLGNGPELEAAVPIDPMSIGAGRDRVTMTAVGIIVLIVVGLAVFSMI